MPSARLVLQLKLCAAQMLQPKYHLYHARERNHNKIIVETLHVTSLHNR
jgi:hypothetical protein